MKEIIASLKHFATSGKLKKGPIVLTMLLLVFGLLLVALIPIYPLLALQLMGLPISISFSSYFGSLLMILFFYMLRGKTGQDLK